MPLEARSGNWMSCRSSLGTTAVIFALALGLVGFFIFTCSFFSGILGTLTCGGGSNSTGGDGRIVKITNTPASRKSPAWNRMLSTTALGR